MTRKEHINRLAYAAVLKELKADDNAITRGVLGEAVEIILAATDGVRDALGVEVMLAILADCQFDVTYKR